MLVYLERDAIGVKTIKWRSAFTSLLVFLLAISITLPYDVMAHEFSPKRYWNDIYFDSNTKKHIVRLNANIKNVTDTVYNRVLCDAINNKTWAHEIGHVMGLNETNDGTRSVMRQGKGSTFGWSNYWQPQAHDTADLSRYRYVSWS